MSDRTDVVTFKGNPMTLVGPHIRVGQQAPPFKVVGLDLADLDLDRFKDKLLVISVAPSVDTGLCAIQTRTFNAKAAALGENVAILCISLDLPFALKRFCAAEGIDKVVPASDYKYRSFGEAYGVYMRELGLLARAVFVIDQTGKISHAEYVAEGTNEPDYDAALEAVKATV